MTPRKKILIVDDEYFLSETMKLRFEHEGYAVACAEDGNEALHQLREAGADLVIMDIMMPGLDGLAATRAIREDRKLKNTPVIVLTARARDEDRIASVQAGANDYLVKPFEVGDLIAKVQKWLKL